MSINAMTNAAIGRRPDFEPVNDVPKGLAGIAEAAGSTPAPAQPAGQLPAKPPAPQGSAVNSALQSLTTYIPTEVLTLYVAAVAALAPLKDSHGRWLPFWIFLVGTPLITWLAFATKVKSAGRPIPLRPSSWPVWEMSAAMIAFAAWAFALPETPFLDFDKWYSKSIAGLAVMIVSYGLGALGPLMQRSLPS